MSSKEEIYVLEINLDTLFDIKTGRIKYKDIPKYPGISKDLAFVLSKDINSGDVITTIRQAGGKLLKSTEVFDYYEGENIGKDKKSIAYNLYFEDSSKTLSESEVNPIFNKIIENVIKKHNAILRDK